ncbi:hypothetical protein [Burkholderia vietnamiensis]|uniref:hypothetical protein n=1 Tax=Burkholderia vietnamiensis TaxID=60552 RepID=UPI000D8A93E1|nr:hypothetical protein [Burkholderia vietnamiensis]GBH28732.1 hypothetical protein BvRS1_57810 [Burkholderia vietnamiensis]
MADIYFTEQERQSRKTTGTDSPVTDLEIATRRDLSFTATDDSPGIRSNWNVSHDMNGYWHDSVRVGRRYFAEIAELAAKDEEEAFDAVLYAIMAREWNHTPDGAGWGIEHGFSERLAAATILGLRAMRNGAAPYDPERSVACDEEVSHD